MGCAAPCAGLQGSEIIRLYHTLLGPQGFRKGMDLYFQRHDGQVSGQRMEQLQQSLVAKAHAAAHAVENRGTRERQRSTGAI